MSPLDRLNQRLYEVNALDKANALMGWDRQVLMPAGGGEARNEHVGRLSRMAHELFVSDETQRLLEEAEAAASTEDEKATVRVVRREMDIKTKLPTELVERKSRTGSAAYDTWKKAKATSDYALLAPYYQELFDIARETAEHRGYTDHIYDPLIDLFEEGATYKQARQMFDALKPEIVGLVNQIQSEGKPVDDSFLHADWDQPALRDFAEKACAAMGYDFERGRLDLANNAFCTNFSCNDVRMTTRPARHISGVLFSSFHEMGHGLYEQNSPRDWDRTPLAGGISLGVHESQSRTWENVVGRSRPFWSRFLPALQEKLPALKGKSLDEFYRGINKVQPGLIRIGSDELTYNLHILLRFELETELMTNQVSVKDLPDAWNAKIEAYLGLTPPNDGEGVLQDVHWSRGYVGYFPTYTMGNLIGWQVWRTLQRDLGDTDALIADGNFAPILGWLTDKIYSQGKRYQPNVLVQRVTGEPMKADSYIGGMREKFADIYGLA